MTAPNIDNEGSTTAFDCSSTNAFDGFATLIDDDNLPGFDSLNNSNFFDQVMNASKLFDGEASIAKLNESLAKLNESMSKLNGNDSFSSTTLRSATMMARKRGVTGRRGRSSMPASVLNKSEHSELPSYYLAEGIDEVLVEEDETDSSEEAFQEEILCAFLLNKIKKKQEEEEEKLNKVETALNMLKENQERDKKKVDDAESVTTATASLSSAGSNISSASTAIPFSSGAIKEEMEDGSENINTIAADKTPKKSRSSSVSSKKTRAKEGGRDRRKRASERPKRSSSENRQRHRRRASIGGASVVSHTIMDCSSATNQRRTMDSSSSTTTRHRMADASSRSRMDKSVMRNRSRGGDRSRMMDASGRSHMDKSAATGRSRMDRSASRSRMDRSASRTRTDQSSVCGSRIRGSERRAEEPPMTPGRSQRMRATRTRSTGSASTDEGGSVVAPATPKKSIAPATPKKGRSRSMGLGSIDVGVPGVAPTTPRMASVAPATPRKGRSRSMGLGSTEESVASVAPSTPRKGRVAPATPKKGGGAPATPKKTNSLDLRRVTRTPGRGRRASMGHDMLKRNMQLMDNLDDEPAAAPPTPNQKKKHEVWKERRSRSFGGNASEAYAAQQKNAALDRAKRLSSIQAATASLVTPKCAAMKLSVNAGDALARISSIGLDARDRNCSDMASVAGSVAASVATTDDALFLRSAPLAPPTPRRMRRRGSCV